MIPLELRLRGLHSFREEQTLNFGQVLGHGVFGIFGPTGSGKSTVLDAITLALYGRVERAPSGIQGICNQAEDRLEVDFTFELAGSEGPRRYRAQRSYTRVAGGADALRTAKCRLSEIAADGTVVVLAEKERDMTRAVSEILGLTVEDFTRAVVLPQGRFAEFLRLGGVERRRMLQRLFDLERYGDALSARVKERVDRTQRGLDGVDAELAGIGDASEEALCAAEDRQAAAQAGVRTADLALQAARAQRETAAQIWAGQQELHQVEESEARLAAAEPEVQRAEAELRAAERAEQVRPVLDSAVEARDGLAAAVARAAETAMAAAVRGEEAATARRARDEARRLRAEQEGPLQERRVRLTEAVRIEAELQRAQAERAGADAAVSAGEQRLADAQAAATRADHDRTEARHRAQAAEARLHEVQVDLDERERVDAAVRALAEHRRAAAARDAAGERVAAAQVAAIGKEAAAAQAAQDRGGAQGAYAAVEQDLRNLGETPRRPDAAEWAAALADASRSLEALLRSEAEAAKGAQALEAVTTALTAAEATLLEAEATAERAAEALGEAQRQGLAVSLASALVDGRPCPVCGSPHHPAPVSAEAAADIAAAEQATRTARAASNAAVAQQGAARATLASEQRAADQAAGALQQARANLEQALQRLPRSARTLDPEALGAYLRDEEDALRRLQASQEQWEAARAALDRRRDEALQTLLATQSSFTEQQGAATAARSTAAAAEDALRTAGEAEAQAALALDSARAGWTDEGIEQARQDLTRRDQEARRLLEEMRSLSAAAEAGDQAATQARAALDAVQTEVQAQREAARALAADVLRLGADLERATGGGPRSAADQLAEVEAGLQGLAEAEAHAQAAAEAADSALSAARTAEGAASTEHRGAAARAEATARKLARALADAAFETEDELREAFREPSALTLLRARIDAHQQQRIRLAAERERLSRLVAGRSLSPEQWEQTNRDLEAAEAGARAAQQALGEARTVLGATRERHARWSELRAQRADLEARRLALADLQSVLRGAAFVEFIAEEQLRGVALEASARLGQLTNFRYALEVDAQGGFCIRDDWNGGTRRSVSTLSGGETFLTSLALALALSAQIQLRGRYPLQFFFLDEGFGTLDPEALDTAMAALERLQADSVHIGVISHVPEVRARLSRRVVVEPAQPGGPGSRLRVEVA